METSQSSTHKIWRVSAPLKFKLMITVSLPPLLIATFTSPLLTSATPPTSMMFTPIYWAKHVSTASKELKLLKIGEQPLKFSTSKELSSFSPKPHSSFIQTSPINSPRFSSWTAKKLTSTTPKSCSGTSKTSRTENVEILKIDNDRCAKCILLKFFLHIINLTY